MSLTDWWWWCGLRAPGGAPPLEIGRGNRRVGTRAEQESAENIKSDRLNLFLLSYHKETYGVLPFTVLLSDASIYCRHRSPVVSQGSAFRKV